MSSETQIPIAMTAIAITRLGGPEVLVPQVIPVPIPRAGEVLIEVAAAGVNRPDILQRLGHYPPPPGASDIPGLEVAGKIVGICPETVSPYPLGTRVCALLSGGGYAEYAVAPVGQILPLPDSVSDIEGATLPEGLFTVYQNVFKIGRLAPHESILIHGGASGIGTLAIQMVRYAGRQNDGTSANIFVTCGTDDKCAACLKLGATHAINYKTQDFVAEILRLTWGQGVDLVLDMLGGDEVSRNLSCLKPGGRHVSIAMLKGSQATIDLRMVMTRNLTLTGSTLRPRRLEEKRELRDVILTTFWPGVTRGVLGPVIHQVFGLQEAAAAHAELERGVHIGKIVLKA